MVNEIIIRERTPFWLMVYGVYLYFCCTSFRRASRALEPWIERSYVAIWGWVQKLGFLADRFAFGRDAVESFLVDETQIKVGAQEAWLWLAFEPRSRKILGFYLSRARNMLVAYNFLKELRRKYGKKTLYTDGGAWYIQAAKWARLEHLIYDEYTKNVVERFIETLKDRLECFDDYFPCMKEDCECEHVRNWISVYALIYNYVRDHMALGRPPVRDLERMMEVQRFQELFRRCLS